MSLVIKLDGVSFNNAKLPVWDGNLIVDSELSTESGATAHWLFGVDNSSYLDLTGNNHSLIEAGIAPIFNPNSVEVSYGASLDTGIMNGISSELTVCMVFKNDSVRQMPFNSMNKTLGIANGLSIFTGAGDSTIYANGRSENKVAQLQLQNISAGYIFVSMSVGDGAFSLYCPNASDPILNNFSSFKSVYANAKSDENYHIGPKLYVQQYLKTNVSECIVFDKAMSKYEMENIYNRSKYRMAIKGISI